MPEGEQYVSRHQNIIPKTSFNMQSSGAFVKAEITDESQFERSPIQQINFHTKLLNNFSHGQLI